MARMIFDGRNPDLTLVRQVIFQRLRDRTDPDQGWQKLEVDTGLGFEPYVEYPTST